MLSNWSWHSVKKGGSLTCDQSKSLWNRSWWTKIRWGAQNRLQKAALQWHGRERKRLRCTPWKCAATEPWWILPWRGRERVAADRTEDMLPRPLQNVRNLNWTESIWKKSFHFIVIFTIYIHLLNIKADKVAKSAQVKHFPLLSVENQ